MRPQGGAARPASVRDAFLQSQRLPEEEVRRFVPGVVGAESDALSVSSSSAGEASLSRGRPSPPQRPLPSTDATALQRRCRRKRRPPATTPEEREERRRESNRLAAARSRAKRRSQEEILRAEVDRLRRENDALRMQNARLSGIAMAGPQQQQQPQQQAPVAPPASPAAAVQPAQLAPPPLAATPAAGQADMNNTDLTVTSGGTGLLRDSAVVVNNSSPQSKGLDLQLFLMSVMSSLPRGTMFGNLPACDSAMATAASATTNTSSSASSALPTTTTTTNPRAPAASASLGSTTATAATATACAGPSTACPPAVSALWGRPLAPLAVPAPNRPASFSRAPNTGA